MSTFIDPFDPENLRIDPQSVARLARRSPLKKTGDGVVRRLSKVNNFKFYQFPAAVVEQLLQIGQTPTFALLAILYELWFTNLNRNPLRLSSRRLEKYKISRYKKQRALQLLKKAGIIEVEQLAGKNPLVTLKWLPIKK